MTFLPLHPVGGGVPDEIEFLIFALIILVSWALSAFVLVLIKEFGNVQIKRIWLMSLIFSFVVLLSVIIIARNS
jgi:hypothetical protein